MKSVLCHVILCTMNLETLVITFEQRSCKIFQIGKANLSNTTSNLNISFRNIMFLGIFYIYIALIKVVLSNRFSGFGVELSV